MLRRLTSFFTRLSCKGAKKSKSKSKNDTSIKIEPEPETPKKTDLNNFISGRTMAEIISLQKIIRENKEEQEMEEAYAEDDASNSSVELEPELDDSNDILELTTGWKEDEEEDDDIDEVQQPVEPGTSAQADSIYQLDDVANEILTPRIARSQIVVFKDQRLMRGSYGIVKKGKVYMIAMKKFENNKSDFQVNKKYIAAKRINDAKTDLNLFINEIAILKSCNHPNILGFIGIVFVNKSKFYMITELCEGGDLNNWIKNPNNSKWLKTNIFEVTELALDIAKGIEYLHRNEIIHRDLKPANILMSLVKARRSVDSNQESFCKKWIPKIADFGFAISVKHGYQRHFEAPKTATSQVGTFEWMAPEIQNRDPGSIMLNQYSKKSDVYAFGMVLTELLVGKTPYDTMKKDTLMALLKLGKLHFSEIYARVDAPKRLIDLMWNCTDVHILYRPQFYTIVKELHDIKLEILINKEFSFNTEFTLKCFVGQRRPIVAGPRVGDIEIPICKIITEK